MEKAMHISVVLLFCISIYAMPSELKSKDCPLENCHQCSGEKLLCTECKVGYYDSTVKCLRNKYPLHNLINHSNLCKKKFTYS